MQGDHCTDFGVAGGQVLAVGMDNRAQLGLVDFAIDQGLGNQGFYLAAFNRSAQARL